MKTQNYQNYSTLRYLSRTQLIHIDSIILVNILAISNLIHSIISHSGIMNALLLFFIGLSLCVGYFVFRSFSLKAQDRAIRAEENLRHFVLSGKLFDKNLRISQIVALRFAPDEELIELSERAVLENLSSKEIKKSIKNWKEDLHRA